MQIERVKTEHVAILAPLFDDYRQFYGQKSNPDECADFLLERISNEEAIAFIAVDPLGVGQGFTLLYPSFSSVSMSKVYVLNDLYVNKEHRRASIASHLLKFACRWAKTQKAIRLHLETELSNSAAQALYEQEGWKKDVGHFHYYKVL